MKKSIIGIILLIIILSLSCMNVFATTGTNLTAEYKEELNKFQPEISSTAYNVIVEKTSALKFHVKVTGKGWNETVYVDKNIEIPGIIGLKTKTFEWKTNNNQKRYLVLTFFVKNCSTPEITETPIVTIEPTPEITAEVTPEITTTIEPTSTPTPVEEEKLPNTGESNPLIFLVFGMAIILSSVFVAIRMRLQKQK